MVIDGRRTGLTCSSRSSGPLHRLVAGLVVAVLLQGHVLEAHAQSAAGDAAGAIGVGTLVEHWRLSSSIGIDETWSDNINLAPRGAERSDFVTTISPALRIARNTSRLSLSLGYNPQFLYYARGTNGSALRNQLDALAKVTLIQNVLTFDTSIFVSQSNVSPFGTLTTNNVNGNSNRAETRTYSFGPTLQSRFGSDFSYSAGYRFTGSGSDSEAYATSHTNTLYANFQSGTSYKDLGYGANINRTAQDYGGAGQIVTESLSGNLSYVVAPTFRLQSAIGYDRNSYPTAGQSDLSGVSYSGGFIWTPSRHTQLNAQIGHRYLGPTANISFTHSTARTALSISYSRDQSTSQAAGLGLVADPTYALVDQIFQALFPDPAQRAAIVAATLRSAGLSTSQYATSNFVSNQIYLSKTFSASLALLGLRNTVNFNVSRSDSQSLSNLTTVFDVFNTANKFRQTLYSANWAYKLGPRTSVNAYVSKVHNKALIGDGDTRQRLLSASINRQLGKRLNGTVQYRNTRQDSGGAASVGVFSGNYKENAILGSLRLDF